MRQLSVASATPSLIALCAGMIALSPASADARSGRQNNYDIASGTLMDALARYEATTGQVVEHAEGDLEGKMTRGVRGYFSADQALRRILTGTGLKQCRKAINHVVLVDQVTSCEDFAPVNDHEIVVTGTAVSHIAVSNRTGTRMDADPMTLPMSISTVSEGLLQKQQALNLGDAAANVAGVTPGVDGSFNIRGFSAGTMRNGNLAADSRSNDLPIVAISRLEVVKGPEAIIAGTTVGYGGVVNVITKTPQDKFIAEFMATGGTRGYYDTGIDVGGPINTDHSILVRLVASTQDSDRSLNGYDGKSNDYISPSITFKNKQLGTEFTAQYEYQRLRRAPDLLVYTNEKKLTNDLAIPRIGAKSDGVESKDRTLTLSLNQKLFDGWSFAAKYSSQKVNRDTATPLAALGDDFGFAFPNLFVIDSLGDSQIKVDFVKLEIRGKFDTGPLQHSLLFAFDQTKTHIEVGSRYTGVRTFNIETGNGEDLTPIFGPAFGIPADGSPSVRTIGGLDPVEKGYLVLDQIKWGELYVLGGFRVIRYDPNPRLVDPLNPIGQFKRSLPSLGVLYRVTKDISVYGSAAKAFQPNPGLYGLGDGSVPPEDSRQYEAGVKALLFNEKVATSLSVYRIQQKNVAVPDPSQPNPVCLGGTVCYISVPGVRSQGVEVEVSGRLGTHLELRGTYAYADKKAGEAVAASSIAYARHTGTLYATYNFGAEGRGPWVGANAQARSRGINDPLTDARNPGQVRLDLSAGFAAEKWDFIAGVKNVANARLYDVGSGAFGVGTVLQPREWFTTIRYRFR